MRRICGQDAETRINHATEETRGCWGVNVLNWLGEEVKYLVSVRWTLTIVRYRRLRELPRAAIGCTELPDLRAANRMWKRERDARPPTSPPTFYL